MYNKQLKVFVAVADCGSFNKAAEKLYISAPAVLKQVNALEKHLDLELFKRTSHGITLTPAGKVIYRHAKYIFDYSDQAIAEAHAEAAVVSKTFCIGSSFLNPCKPFMDLWYEIDDHFPGYHLHIVPYDDNKTETLSQLDLLGEKYDFIMGVCDSKTMLEHCQFEPLGTYQHCIAVSREHPLAKKKILNISDLYGQTVIMVKEGDSNSVDVIRDELSKHPEITIESTDHFYDMNVFNECIKRNCCMITVECWKDVHPSLVTIPVKWDFPIPYGIFYPLHPEYDDVEKLIKVARHYVANKEHNS